MKCIHCARRSRIASEGFRQFAMRFDLSIINKNLFEMSGEEHKKESESRSVLESTQKVSLNHIIMLGFSLFTRLSGSVAFLSEECI